MGAIFDCQGICWQAYFDIVLHRKRGAVDAIWGGRWICVFFLEISSLFDRVTSQEGIFKRDSNRPLRHASFLCCVMLRCNHPRCIEGPHGTDWHSFRIERLDTGQNCRTLDYKEGFRRLHDDKIGCWAFAYFKPNSGNFLFLSLPQCFQIDWSEQTHQGRWRWFPGRLPWPW